MGDHLNVPVCCRHRPASGHTLCLEFHQCYPHSWRVASGSSWAKVILPLEQHGLRVIAAPIPLTSLSNDVAALTRVIERTSGPYNLAPAAFV